MHLKIITHDKIVFDNEVNEIYTKGVDGEFGVLKGIYLGTKRILRCNPKTKGGEDYLPLNIKGEKKWVF